MKYLMIITVLFLIIGCSDVNTKKTISDISNPASKKCIDDGFTLVGYKKNDIVIGYFCVNEDNGKKCKEWDYFRGDCALK